MAKKDSKKSKKQDNNRWFKDFKAELKKITWPNRKELIENTTVVLSMVVIVAVIICILDLAFKSLNRVEINQVVKLKNSITVNGTVETEESEESEETSETAETDGSEETSDTLNNEKSDEATDIEISE